MNLLISHHWLKDYLDTPASPEKIAECLSLCGASVEKIEKFGNDKVYDIEVTTNRVDMMSVAGIARELSAILPQFGIRAKLRRDPYKNWKLETGNWKPAKLFPLKAVIKSKSLCPRFTAVVLDNVSIMPSSEKIKKRLEASGFRALNNVVDISNYLMREYGQPVHTFDYDKIKKQTMIMRKSKKGERLITLDGKEQKLPGDDIVIEDGGGRLIDLCGIMGGKNSAVDQNTKRVLLFVQTYNPVNIRQTSMKLAHRTDAAQLFEKNTDPELVMPTLLYGIQLFEKLAGAKQASEIIDIYPHPCKEKKIKLSLQFIEERLGVSLQPIKVKKILDSLGLSAQLTTHNSQLTISVPSWRNFDIDVPEDIVEEVARIYGYHNLPSAIPAGSLPKLPNDKTFYWESVVKCALKNYGYTEAYTYSLQSKKELLKFRLDPKYHFKLKNPLSFEWKYLRTSIIPSLLDVFLKNKKCGNLHLFELTKVYLPQKKGLPYEVQRLSILSSDDFHKTKGLLEQILGIMNIEADFEPHEKITQLNPSKTAIVKHKSKDIILGTIGEVFRPVLASFEIEQPITIVDLNFDKLALLAKRQKKYSPLSKYPPIIEKLTFINLGKVLSKDIVEKTQKTHKLIKSVQISDTYKNRLSLEIIYQSKKRSLKDKEVGKIRKEIVKRLEKTGLKLHGKLK